MQVFRELPSDAPQPRRLPTRHLRWARMRLLLHSWFCLATVSASGALGIDVGSANSVVAVTRRGGVDVVANEATRRQTPSVVAFDERRRFKDRGILIDHSCSGT